MQWLGKTRKLLHPSGVELTTPLLIPSFSSRGFSARKGVFSVRELLELTAPELTDCVLLSAYDLSKRNRLPSLEKFPLNVKVTFLDSGGYETGGEPDMSAIYGDSVRDPNWNETRLTKVYDRWPKSKPAVLVSFDHVDKRKRLHAQIESALKLFSRYPGQLTCFLIKPEQKKDFYLEGALHALLKNPKDVQKFSIIGVTEKELGVSFLDRMKKIVELRLGLDEAGLVCPIHVFGSLDPISTCLYFLSGAELFDGKKSIDILNHRIEAKVLTVELPWHGYVDPRIGGLGCGNTGIAVEAVGQNFVHPTRVRDIVMKVQFGYAGQSLAVHVPVQFHF